MILNFMKKDALDMLVADVSNNLELYMSDEKWIDNYFENKGMSSYCFNSQIMVPDVELIIGDSKTDFKNAVKIYEAFRGKLNRVQASDWRLWSYLAHNIYWEYMCVRWRVNQIEKNDNEKDNAIARIRERYLSETSSKSSKGKAFVRHGIARLYWSAFLTYDEENMTNPYELTEYFLSKQDIFVGSAERSFARNKPVLLAALKVLRDQKDLQRSVIRQYFVELNQAGGIIVLDSLTKDSAMELAKRTLDNVMLEINNL